MRQIGQTQGMIYLQSRFWNYSYERCRITETALLGALLMLYSCGARQRLGQAPTVNTNQIPVTSASQRDSHSRELKHGISIDDAVLVHMITNMDQSERHVFFINPTGSIQD